MVMKKKITFLALLCTLLALNTVPVFADTNPMDYSNKVEVSSDIVKVIVMVVVFVLIYFFSTQIQKNLGKFSTWFSKKIGTYSTSKEYYLQRYTYQHQGSPLTKLYTFVNEQLIALGYKRLGITVVGYLLFWGFVALAIAIVLQFILNLTIILFPLLWAIVLTCVLVMTRVSVSERMERREADIMNAIDLIIPEIGNGVKNAIVTYIDNFAPSVREDFKAFVSNVQERGYTFEDAMYILTDNLGIVFKDFAQKAVYYEAIGEKEMLEIFSDITETNRLRRQLRDENASAFQGLRASFLMSVVATVGYFLFIIFTDEFSRYFFLTKPVGKFLLLVIVLIIFGVLAYISTIKSRVI